MARSRHATYSILTSWPCVQIVLRAYLPPPTFNYTQTTWGLYLLHFEQNYQTFSQPLAAVYPSPSPLSKVPIFRALLISPSLTTHLPARENFFPPPPPPLPLSASQRLLCDFAQFIHSRRRRQLRWLLTSQRPGVREPGTARPDGISGVHLRNTFRSFRPGKRTRKGVSSEDEYIHPADQIRLNARKNLPRKFDITKWSLASPPSAPPGPGVYDVI